jgi:hypothetical protein
MLITGEIAYLIDMDIDSESQRPCSPLRDQKSTRQFIHAGKIPLPLRRRHIIADALKIALFLTASA